MFCDTVPTVSCSFVDRGMKYKVITYPLLQAASELSQKVWHRKSTVIIIGKHHRPGKLLSHLFSLMPSMLLCAFVRDSSDGFL